LVLGGIKGIKGIKGIPVLLAPGGVKEVMIRIKKVKGMTMRIIGAKETKGMIEIEIEIEMIEMAGHIA